MIQTNATRLQFVVRFATMNLATLRPGDVLNLRDDVSTFLTGGSEGMQIPYRGGLICHAALADYPLQDFETLQEEVRALLTAIASSGDMTFPGTKMLDLQGRYAVVSSRVRRTPGQGMHLTVIGSVRDMFLFALLWILNSESADRLQQCPECSSVFYRIGRRQYCSPPCLNRANGRHWREREENKEKTRERVHNHYKAKKIAQGQTTVHRRPRKPPAVQADA